MQIVLAVSKHSIQARFGVSRRGQEKMANKKLTGLTLAALLLTSTMVSYQPKAFAQGSPIPGGTRTAPADNYSAPAKPTAPLPGGSPAAYAAAPPAHAHAATPGAPGKRDSIYNSLPLNAEEAKVRLEDLSNRLAVSRPDDMKDAIYALSEWLQDCADAHWKMFKAFEKIDSTKAQAAKEKDIALKFSALKNKAKLLKADLFIKQNRYPEALGPLVEIVTTEPTTTTGQEAYKRLVDMGFSDSVNNVELAEKGTGKR
ncbi:MAG: hypothetical protein SGJ27_00190 [Candidatus Melainabacteria bacterium]|nr:hypothetical protein [Candidatus Melainabacteria bacterium]